MNVLIFDTETTGVPKNYSAPVSDLDAWSTARLVQLGYVGYIDGNLAIEREFLVKPNGFVISEEVSKIHGITHKRAESDGTPLSTVLGIFRNILTSTDLVVAHNASYDLGVVGSEFWRMYGNNPLDGISHVCTMKSTTNLVKLPGKREGQYKYPKLEELYRFLFGESMSEAHTALKDVKSTARCYFELKSKGLIE